MTQHSGGSEYSDRPEYSEQADQTDPQMLSVAEQLGRRASVSADGSLDLLATVGGWRGLVEAVLPSAVFLVAFITLQDIWLSGGASVGVAALFSIVRLAQRQSPMQALTGLAGVALCVAVALLTGEARQYYVVGFYTNAVYAVALAISMVVRWPIMGLVYGFLRGEGLQWGREQVRLRRYQVATGFLIAMFIARLAVQLPLYWADDIAALGTARLVMGVPLYAMTLWLAWLVSRPVPEPLTTARSDDRGIL